MIICIEGLDSSGKCTQSKLLAEAIGAKRFAFPSYGTPLGKLIDGHLKRRWMCCRTGDDPMDHSQEDLDALVFQGLQTANRMEVAPDIVEAAEKGHVVLDRYWPSGVVYGQADGLDREYLINIHRCLPQADLPILIDINPGISVDRRPERRDRYESNMDFMEKVAQLYRELWGHMNWIVLDGDRTIDEIHQDILYFVNDRLRQ